MFKKILLSILLIFVNIVRVGAEELNLDDAKINLNSIEESQSVGMTEYNLDSVMELNKAQSQIDYLEWQKNVDRLKNNIETYDDAIVDYQIDLDKANEYLESLNADQIYADGVELDKIAIIEEAESNISNLESKIKNNENLLNTAQENLSDAETQTIEAKTEYDNFDKLENWTLKEQSLAAKEIANSICWQDPNSSACDEMQDIASDKKETYNSSDEAKDDISSPSFMIKVNNISPWMEVTPGNNTKQNVNKALWTIIQSLMVALWSLALLIMTVGAGYMIMHSGRDELLSKWKAIFMSWVYALLVALSSYYLIAIIRYILYK